MRSLDFVKTGAASRQELVGDSDAIRELKRHIEVVARTELPVLIEGETGTGKELVAEMIHTRSRRASKAFVTVDCSTIPETLLESELFGHGKGAFTGAMSSYAGRIAEADGGVLFFDEIGSVTTAVQAKLLRFLETGEFPRVREPGMRRVDTRVVTATSQFLEDGVQEGRVRKDFYYRLSAAYVWIPPLRERKEDILPIADRMLRGRGIPSGIDHVSKRAMNQLLEHDWPGNVRELKNALATALAHSQGGPIEAIGLGRGRRVRTAPDVPRSLRGYIRSKEREFLVDLMAEKDANLSDMADAADVSVRTLQRKLSYHNLRR